MERIGKPISIKEAIDLLRKQAEQRKKEEEEDRELERLRHPFYNDDQIEEAVKDLSNCINELKCNIECIITKLEKIIETLKPNY